MQKKFKTASYLLANKKWVPKYCVYIQSGRLTNEQPVIIQNKYFETKEEADQFAREICVRKGYTIGQEK